MGVFFNRFVFWFALLVSSFQIANAQYEISPPYNWEMGGVLYPAAALYCNDIDTDCVEAVKTWLNDGAYTAVYAGSTTYNYSSPLYQDSNTVNCASGTLNAFSDRMTGTPTETAQATIYFQAYRSGSCKRVSLRIFDRDDPNADPYEPYTPEQCSDFGGLTGDTGQQSQYTGMDIPLGGTGCYKGCTVQRPFLGDSWTLGSMQFNEVQYTGGSCESIQPEEKEGCFEYQDNYLNWHQVCSVPPDVQPEDPEYPQDGSDPQDCLNVYDVDGNIVDQLCDPEPEKENSCWLDQGEIYCAGFSAEGYSCTKINGVSSCSYTGGGGVIDPDSVDHPDNGGNGDGDPTNDIFEPDAQGNVAGGGYGYGGSGSYTQDTPSTSDKLLASDIGNEVAESMAGLVPADSIDIGDGSAIEGHGEALDGLGQSFVDAIGQTEIASISNQLTSALSSKTGTCPEFSFTIDFLSIGEVGTDLHCVFAADYGTVIKALMLFVYIIMFIRIVMGA
jgi:hypothetical protein